jgi:DNA-binding LytR/AlgR family response regulator
VNGADLAAHIRSRRPATQVLFVSGFVTQASGNLPALDEHTAFLAKPFTAETLARTVRDQLALTNVEIPVGGSSVH